VNLWGRQTEERHAVKIEKLGVVGYPHISQKVPARLHIEERIQLWNSAVHIEEFMTIFRKGRKEKKHPYPVLPFREVVGNPTFIPESPKPASWHGG
jgi:hypothetical protein